MLRTIAILTVSLALLSGCGLFKKPVQVTVDTEINLARAQRLKPIKTFPVKWHVVTAENLDKFLAKVKWSNGNVVFIAISTKDYQNLSLNMQEILRYLKSQKAVIMYYEGFLYEENVEKGSGKKP